MSRHHFAFATKVKDQNGAEPAGPAVSMSPRDMSLWIQKYVEETRTKSGRPAVLQCLQLEERAFKGTENMLFCRRRRFHVAYWTQQRSDELDSLALGIQLNGGN